MSAMRHAAHKDSHLRRLAASLWFQPHVERILASCSATQETSRLGVFELCSGAGSGAMSLADRTRQNHLVLHCTWDTDTVANAVVRSLHGRGLRAFERGFTNQPMHTNPRCSLVQHGDIHSGKPTFCSFGAGIEPACRACFKPNWWLSAGAEGVASVLRAFNLDGVVVTAGPPCNESGGPNRQASRDESLDFQKNVETIKSAMQSFRLAVKSMKRACTASQKRKRH